ncbi:MAG: hypothetical protein ABJN35_13785 [Erythrobacter sp.]
MSNNMFANPKTALGFAGVTIAIGVAASFGASHFLPTSGQDVEAAEVVEAPAAPTVPATASQAPATTAWADEEFTDDWNTSAVDTANGFNGPQSADSQSEPGEPTFGDFAPQSRDASRSAGSARRGPTRSAPGPVIRSGAAPDAPELRPPGGGGSGELVQVD